MLLLASSMSIITRGFQRGFCLFLNNSKHSNIFGGGGEGEFPLSSIMNFEISLSLWVFWMCCKNLISVKFTIMESLKLSWISLDKYFFVFFPNILPHSMNAFFDLISLFHFILRNYILTQHGWKVLHDLIFSKVQHYVNAWLINKNLSHLTQGWVEFW